MTKNLSYCARQVRQYDPDRFLCTLFAPAEKRELLFALYAFNLEIAKTREVVREPIMGQIRLQWWREAIAELYAGTVRQHEVLRALADVAGVIDEATLQALIDARETDLDDRPPASTSALKQYAYATGGGLMLAALRLLGDDDEAHWGAVLDSGEAMALTGLVRAIPFHSAQSRCYLPADMLRQVGLEMPLQVAAPQIATLTEIICMEARRLLDRHKTHFDRRVVAAVLPARLARLYLARLKACGYDPFHPRMQAPFAVRPLTVLSGWFGGFI